jgi:hypothetical protein
LGFAAPADRFALPFADFFFFFAGAALGLADVRARRASA